MNVDLRWEERVYGKVDHRTNMWADALTVHKLYSLASYYVVCFCPAMLVANCLKSAAWVLTHQLQQCSMNAVLVNVAAAEGLLLLQGGG